MNLEYIEVNLVTNKNNFSRDNYDVKVEWKLSKAKLLYSGHLSISDTNAFQILSSPQVSNRGKFEWMNFIKAKCK